MLRRLFFVLIAIVLAAPVAAQPREWKPLDPSELAMTTPKVQADADAEALLWEVWVADEMSVAYELQLSTVFHHYVKIKIFTDRGREAYATVDIPYVNGMDVRDVAARTTRPDGSSVELKRSDIFKRTIVKANDFKVQAVSFAVPAIDRGVIVEYRWREVYRDSLASNLRLPFSRELPVHLVRYYVKPLDFGGEFAMSGIPFNAAFAPPQEVKGGYTMISLEKVAADREEPYDLPQFERRPWLFLHYVSRGAPKGAEYWQKFSKALYEDYARRAKPNDDIRKLAASSVTGAATETERAVALVGVVRERVKRYDLDTTQPAARRQSRENRNAADVLKRGTGNGEDTLVLFLALAQAAGLDARVAAAPNRADFFHKAHHENDYFVRGRIAAVRRNQEWLFFDPSNEHSGSGDLPWYYEWQEVLIGDPKGVVSARTPLSAPDKSAKRRTGTFVLSEDGTLEGECALTYTGQWSATFREQEDQQTPAERERTLKESLEKRFPGIEVSQVRIENVENASAPYKNVYRVRIPGYAQRTGSRLFLTPGVFQKGIGPVFSAAGRTSDVYFPFAWSEEDDVTIEMPPGFELEQPERPSNIEAGAARWALVMAMDQSQNRLVVKRSFAMGLTNTILFPQKTYPALKQFFDRVHAQDGHTLVLRKRGSQ